MGLRLWKVSKLVIRIFKERVLFDLLRSSESARSKKFSFLHSISSRLSAFGIARKFQYVIAVGIVVFFFGSAVYFVNQIYALTLYFTQSDWSGGADTNATINNSNATGWTKFYSKTAGIDISTSGEIKINLETSP